MQQTGTVISSNGKTAMVRFKRSDACGKCNACFTFNKQEADIELDNPINAAPGDTVVIELHGKSVFWASLLVYGIPIVALILGVLLGSLWSDIAAAILGIAFAAGTFFIFRALEPKISRMSTFKPRMIGMAEDDALISPDDNNDQGGNDDE